MMLAVIVLTLGAETLAPCDFECLGTRTLERAVADADWVFVGRVTLVATQGGPPAFGVGTLSASEVFKGKSAAQFKVAIGKYCMGTWLTEGEEYLLFVSLPVPGEPLVVNTCSPSGPTKDAVPELRKLRDQKRPKGNR
jgi:hypothetical protein